MEGDWKLIYYHEDRRCELYNLGEDVGEQRDLYAAQRRRPEATRSRLQATDATFPTRDPRFDPAKRQARSERLRTSGKERREREHGRYLDGDFEPNKDWWGSLPKD